MTGDCDSRRKYEMWQIHAVLRREFRELSVAARGAYL